MKPAGSAPPPNEDDPRNFIDSADALAALHEKTGIPILADYYLRTYPKDQFRAAETPVIDWVSRAADSLKSEWAMDGDTLRLRRYNYFSERLLDVPNRLLRQWRTSKARLGHLPLEALADMGSLPEATLKNYDLEEAMKRKHDLGEEWGMANINRPALRLYASLPPEHRRAAVSEIGLPLSALTPEHLEICEKTLEMKMPENPSPEEWEAGRLLFHLRRPRTYEYQDEEHVRQPILVAPSLLADANGGDEQARQAEQQAAKEKLRALLVARNVSGSKIESALGKVRGPRMGLSVLMRIGGRYWSADRTANGSVTDDGAVAETPGG